jgi:hypothetical protein
LPFQKLPSVHAGGSQSPGLQVSMMPFTGACPVSSSLGIKPPPAVSGKLPIESEGSNGSSSSQHCQGAAYQQGGAGRQGNSNCCRPAAWPGTWMGFQMLQSAPHLVDLQHTYWRKDVQSNKPSPDEKTNSSNAACLLCLILP